MPALPKPDRYHSVTPYLIVADAQKLIDFLIAVFGASVESQMVKPDGKIGHTEVKIGDSIIMLGEAMEGYPPLSSMLYIYVDDADATYAAAIEAGATAITPVADQFYGDRSGGVKDAWGISWWLATHKKDVSTAEMEKRLK